MFIRRLIKTAAVLMLLSAAACSPGTGPTLSAPEAHARARAGTLTLVDIRRPDEWRQTGVAENALRINMAHPKGAAGFVGQVASEVEGDTGAPIGLICRTGNRSRQMQQALREAGFTEVYNVEEGMAGSRAGPGWIVRGLPVEPVGADDRP